VRGARTTILITGGAGFIGSNFVRAVQRERPEWRIRVLDSLTYAGDKRRLAGIDLDFVVGDIADPESARLAVDGADLVVNFAAESHVDRSLLDASDFMRANVAGAYTIMRAAVDAGVETFVQVSTDEVYGESRGRAFTERDILSPRSPYSASKAGGEMQAFAIGASFGLPICITRGVNTVGPWQHPEKAIPLFTINALRDRPLPVYGRGEQRRDRLYVEDHCSAILAVLAKGAAGEIYNVAAGNSRDNITVARAVCARLGKPESLIEFVDDRPGHDWDYILDAGKLRELGWEPKSDFNATLNTTVDWYAANEEWWSPLVEGEFEEYYETQYGRRLGRSASDL
jgi:dTDP-glucose 4,6-dehydratase